MDWNTALLLSIPLLPLLGALVLVIWQKAAKPQAGILAAVIAGLGLLAVLLLLPALSQGQDIHFSVVWIHYLDIRFSLRLDWLSFSFLLTIMAITLTAFLYSFGEKTGEKRSNHYYALLLLFCLGMAGTTIANDLFLFYVFWELMLIASVILIVLWGKGKMRQSTALKYFIITHLGSLMVLVCLILLYVNTGTAEITALTQQGILLPAALQTFLVIFFLIGFCVKMAIVPLHIWLPDAHTVAPMPVTIMLAAAMLAMGTYGILRFPFTIFSLEQLQPFALWMMIAGLLSEIYGALMAFAEKKIKRIIAYSSVSQMGYILYGLGTLNAEGIAGGIMHVVYHAVVKALLFMVVGILMNATDKEDIDDIRGMGKRLPAVTVFAAVGILGISGMPPLGIFNSEWLIFTGGFETAYPVFLTVLTLLGSLFSVFYALRFLGLLFFGEPLSEKIQQPGLTLLIPTGLMVAILLITGLFADPLLNWSMNGLSILLGGM